MAATSEVVIKVPHNWKARTYQEPSWKFLRKGGTRVMAFWHRRAGKDDVALHWTAVASQKRIGNYWHMLPEAAQARKAVWEATNPHTGMLRIDEAFPEGMRAKTRSQEMFIRFINGSSWQLVGSDNFKSLVGSPPIGIVFSEWAKAAPAAWAYLRPILRENGGWAIFITTPEGRNHAVRMYDAHLNDDEWFIEKLTALDTDVYTVEELEKERKEYIAEYGPSAGSALYEQEYMCNFDAAVIGAIYAKDLAVAKEQDRITIVPWEPAKLVFTAWDIGRGDATAIWFWQVLGGKVRVIDYFEDSGEVVTYYLDKLKGKGYKYDTLWLPFDAENEYIVETKNMADICRANGFNVQIVPKWSLENGINAARLLLSKCLVDKGQCQPGLDAMQAYRWDYNQRLEEVKATPVHDWASHGADAFRYMAVAMKQEKKTVKIEYDNRGIV